MASKIVSDIIKKRESFIYNIIPILFKMEEKQRSHVITFTVPTDLKAMLDTIPKTGYYDSLSEFLRDAIRTQLKANRGIATLIAFQLYKTKIISIGKAAVMLNTSSKEAEEMFTALES